MIFKQLVDKLEWVDIKLRFLEIYPDQEKNFDGYEKVLHTLKLIEPKGKKGDKTRIVVWTVPKDGKWVEEEYVSISGANEFGKWDGLLAIEFMKWSEWLAMPIDVISTLLFDEKDLLIHCLWEMTWSGFTQDESQGFLKELKTRVKNVKKDPEKYTTPL